MARAKQILSHYHKGYFLARLTPAMKTDLNEAHIMITVVQWIRTATFNSCNNIYPIVAKQQSAGMGTKKTSIFCQP